MQISTLFQRPAAIKAFNLICGALTGYAVYVNFYQIKLMDMFLYKAVTEKIPLSPMYILAFFILPSVLCMFLLEKFYYKKCGNTADAEYCRIMLPLAGLAVFPVLPANFWCPVIFIFITGIVVFRYAAACFAAQPDAVIGLKAKTVRNLRVYLIILLLGMIANGFYMQFLALDALYLTYFDWGVYLSVTDNVLKGNGFVTNAGEPSFLGSHFSPASILMLAPYIWLFYSKYALFILNSILIFSCGPMIYYFAKSRKIPEIQALMLTGCVIFSPSLINMNLTLFYGFHDIYFFLPLLILFFILYEKGRYVPAFAVFGLTLLIKETVPAFWVGMGFAFMLYGRRRTGLWMIVTGVVYWLTVVKLVIPSISGQAVYDYAGRFDYLGHSLQEIALSPLLKPELFWGHLFRPECILFGILLLLPLFLLCLSRPLLLTGGIVSFVFICLQSSNQLQNICMQYQTEILALIFVNCVFALEKLNNTDERKLPLIRLLATPAAANCRTPLAGAVMTGTIATSLLAFYFCGQCLLGKNSYVPIFDKRSWSGEIADIKALIPEKIPLNATMDLAGHFILRNEVYPQFTPLQNYVLMNLNTEFTNKKEMDRLRRKILLDGYKVIYSTASHGKHLVLYAKTLMQSLPDNIFTLKNEEEWDQYGDSVDIDNPDFKVKIKIQDKTLKAYIRPAKQLKCDADFSIALVQNDDVLLYNSVFGNGVTPAFNSRPDQVYVMTKTLPDDWDTCNNLEVKITSRPAVE